MKIPNFSACHVVIYIFAVAASLAIYWLLTHPFGDLYNVVVIIAPAFLKHPTRYTEVWSPYMDVLPEDEAFSVTPVSDANRTVERITATLHGGKVTYAVGDDIQVNIKLYDFYGNVREFGGDHIRVRMNDESNKASISGYVIDHGNGSYTGYLKALWEGKPNIFVELIYTREEVIYLYELRRQLPSLRTISACFNDSTTNETTDCLPFVEGLDVQYGVCNLTPVNGGMPWYCQMPTSPGLSCKDFGLVIRQPYDRSSIVETVKSPYWRNRTDHGAELQASVRSKWRHEHSKCSNKSHDPLKPICSEYEVGKLWTQRSPIGYFYKNQWILAHCVPARQTNQIECMRGKTLFLYGDSTVKQWYKELQSRLECGSNRAHINDREPFCVNKDANFVMYFMRHNLPGNIIDGYAGSRRLEELIDMIAENTEPVFMLHAYSHYTYYHHSVYRERIKQFRRSIEIIVKQRPKVKLLFKGPHTMISKYLGVSDYYAYVYRLILIEELDGLHDKIVYLDYKDMSIAKLVEDIHPKEPVVKAMVDEMMAYLC